MTVKSSPPVHATTIAIGGHAVIIIGASGRGKSDLALRLIDRGAILVSDDYTSVIAQAGGLWASPPSTIAGRLEARGVGLLDVPYASKAQVRLVIDLDAVPERLPDGSHMTTIAGIAIETYALNGHEASAPIKIEWALKQVMDAQ
jgi:serine kinase of HPr protein (carbohydrate metabolism regulator)